MNEKFNLSILLIYLAAVNLITILLTVADKIKAKNHSFRISEKTLIIFALIGGAVGEYITMIVIRHKTRHKKFMISLPLMIFAQLIIILIPLITKVTA